jgi:general secretion pathway protein M
MTFALPNRVLDYWDSLAPRERNLLAAGLLILLPLVLYFYLWQPLSTDRARLAGRVEQLRGQLAQLRTDSEEIKRLRAQTPTRSAQTLGATAHLAASRFLMTDKQITLTPQGSDRLNVTMEGVAFDTWVRWIGELNIQGVSLTACKVEALPAPGLVRVKATLARSAT